jgi:hypothetical protein
MTCGLAFPSFHNLTMSFCDPQWDKCNSGLISNVAIFLLLWFNIPYGLFVLWFALGKISTTDVPMCPTPCPENLEHDRNQDQRTITTTNSMTDDEEDAAAGQPAGLEANGCDDDGEGNA